MPAAVLPKRVEVVELDAGDYQLRFGRDSCADHWWVELVILDNEDHHDLAILTLTDRDALQLSEQLDEKVREGRRDWP